MAMSLDHPTTSYRLGRAYRDGALICSRVHVAVVRDERIAPERRVPPQIRVCFDEPLDKALRGELERLVRARGARGDRLAETLAPLEVVWDEPRGPRRVIGQLAPPRTQRSAPLEAISFPVRPGTEGSAATPGPRGDR